MISNRCARKSLVTNCNSIISKNYLRFLVDSNDVESEGKKVTNIEMYSVTDGKYLNRLCKIDFSYDEEGDVIDKKTYFWDMKNYEYVLKQTETFTK